MRALRRQVRVSLNLEMALAEEIVRFALRVRPDQATIVPEKRQELTTEGGLAVAGRERKVAAAVARLARRGIVVSLFIAPDEKEVRAAVVLDQSAEDLLRMAVDRQGFSARAYHRVLKVARTIADLAGSDRVATDHVAEALSYRALERIPE